SVMSSVFEPQRTLRDDILSRRTSTLADRVSLDPSPVYETLPRIPIESRPPAAQAHNQLATAPWWLWWNILSLDAPMVACAWAILFARLAHVAVPKPELAALGLTVWLIYTMDRLLDARGYALRLHAAPNRKTLRLRHVFHRAFWKQIAGVAGA